MMPDRSETRGDSVVIRRVCRDDVGLFRDVRLVALADSPDAFGETLAEAQESDWVARIARLFETEPPDRAVFLAVSGVRPVGMVFVRCGSATEPSFLGGMWVHPDLRKCGVGRSLVEHGLRFLRAAQQSRVSLWVTATHAAVVQFYEGIGFQQTGATSTLRPGSGCEIIELSIELL